MKDPTKCCVHLGLNQPLCSKYPFYRIKDKYFCYRHGQKHPNAGNAIPIVDSGALKDRKIQIMNERITKIETNIAKMMGMFEHMLNIKEFRDAVYAVAEEKTHRY